MNALCNCSHDVISLLLDNPEFCSFIEIEELIKGYIIQHYVSQEQALSERLGIKIHSRSVIIPAGVFSVPRSSVDGRIRMKSVGSRKTSVVGGNSGDMNEPNVVYVDEEEIETPKVTMLQRAQ